MVTKEFHPHTELKAADLNELASQVNSSLTQEAAAREGAINNINETVASEVAARQEAEKKKSTIVDIYNLRTTGAILPLNGAYVFNGLPVHGISGHFDGTGQDFVAFCVAHEGSDETDHTIQYYLKSGNDYKYSGAFDTSDTDTPLEVYIAQSFSAYPATETADGLMSSQDKKTLNGMQSQIDTLGEKVDAKVICIKGDGTSGVGLIEGVGDSYFDTSNNLIKTCTSYTDSAHFTLKSIEPAKDAIFLLPTISKKYDGEKLVPIESGTAESIVKLKNGVSKLDDNVSNINNELHGCSKNYVDGKFLNRNNAETTNVNWCYSDYIAFNPDSDVEWRYSEGIAENNARLITYREDKTMINSFTASSEEGARTLSKNASEFKNCVYIRVSFRNEMKGKAVVVNGSNEWKSLDESKGIEDKIKDELKDVYSILHDSEKIEDVRMPMLESQYYNTTAVFRDGATTFNVSSTTSSSSGTACVKLKVAIGEKYKIVGVGSPNGAGLYVLTAENNTIVDKMSKGDGSPIIIDIQQDGYLYVNIASYDQSVHGVFKCISVTVMGIDSIRNLLAKLQDESYLLDAKECGVYDIWEPQSTTNIYATPNDPNNVTCALSYQQFLAEYYDKHLHNDTSSYRVERNLLGYDEGGKEIYEYDYIPKDYNRVVMLSAGMNAIELSGIFGLAYFIDFVVSNYADDASNGLKFLHDNVRFKVVPIICPSSFDREKLIYLNNRGVNINRNFNYNNSWESMTSGGNKNKGVSPESESETNILKKWASSNADKCELWIDCHTDVGNDTQKSFYAVVSDNDMKSTINSEQYRIADYYTAKGFTPEGAGNAWIDGGSNYPKNKMCYEVFGIHCMMIEKYEGDTTIGGTGLNCEEADINNYVLMLRAYILAMLRTSSKTIRTNAWKNIILRRDFD